VRSLSTAAVALPMESDVALVGIQSTRHFSLLSSTHLTWSMSRLPVPQLHQPPMTPWVYPNLLVLLLGGSPRPTDPLRSFRGSLHQHAILLFHSSSICSAALCKSSSEALLSLAIHIFQSPRRIVQGSTCDSPFVRAFSL